MQTYDLEPKTHVIFKFDRQSSIKLKGGGVSLFVAIKVALKLREDLNLFEEEKEKLSQYGLKANRISKLRQRKKR